MTSALERHVAEHVWDDGEVTLIRLLNGSGDETGVVRVDRGLGIARDRRWHRTLNGYAYCTTPKQDLMHRIILGLTKGDGKVVDHINGDRLDNRRSNLRVVTQQQNCHNRTHEPKGLSGVRGVEYAGSYKYMARVRLSGKLHYLGTFPSVEQAERAAISFRLEHMPTNTRDRARALELGMAVPPLPIDSERDVA